VTEPRNTLVVVVDRLGAGFLGPYGATWLDTPALNRLAGQSLLIEHVLSDSPELDIVRIGPGSMRRPKSSHRGP
jgi:hypothetical protein